MNSREFYFQVCKLFNSINNRYDEYAKKHGIESSNSFWIVYYLSYGEAHTQLDICEHCQLPKTTVNTIIKDLEKNGYIELKTGQDKRKRQVSLTEKGNKYAQDILSDLFTKEDKIFLKKQKTLIKMIELMEEFDNSLELLVK